MAVTPILQEEALTAKKLAAKTQAPLTAVPLALPPIPTVSPSPPAPVVGLTTTSPFQSQASPQPILKQELPAPTSLPPPPPEIKVPAPTNTAEEQAAAGRALGGLASPLTMGGWSTLQPAAPGGLESSLTTAAAPLPAPVLKPPAMTTAPTTVPYANIPSATPGTALSPVPVAPPPPIPASNYGIPMPLPSGAPMDNAPLVGLQFPSFGCPPAPPLKADPTMGLPSVPPPTGGAGLRSQTVLPTTDPRLTGTQAAVDQATLALRGAQLPGYTPVSPYDQSTASAAALLGQAQGQIGQAVAPRSAPLAPANYGATQALYGQAAQQVGQAQAAPVAAPAPVNYGASQALLTQAAGQIPGATITPRSAPAPANYGASQALLNQAAGQVGGAQINQIAAPAPANYGASQALLNQAASQLQGATMARQGSLAPADYSQAYNLLAQSQRALPAGGYSPSAEADRARAITMANLEALQGAPNRADLAAQALGLFDERSAPYLQQRYQQVGQQAAALGRIGAGMTTKQLTDVLTQQDQQRSLLQRDLALQAAGQSMADRLNQLQAAQGVGGQFRAEDLGQANFLSNEALARAQMLGG